MTADAATFKTAGEWEAMGDRIRGEFGSALARLGRDWGDGSFLRGGEFPEFSAIERELGSLLTPIRELLALESLLTSGFIPSDLPYKGVFEREVPAEASSALRSESKLVSVAHWDRIENSSDPDSTWSQEPSQALPAANEMVTPPPASGPADPAAGETPGPAAEAFDRRESFAEPKPVRGFRDLARLIESSPANQLPDDPPRKSSRKSAFSLLPSFSRLREVERTEPIPEPEPVSESVDLWGTIAKPPESHDRPPAPSDELRRKEGLLRMGLDVSRQARLPVPNIRRARAAFPQAAFPQTPSASSSAWAANDPGGPNVSQPGPDPEWLPTKEPELRAITDNAQSQTAAASGDLDAILEALSNEIQSSYRRFYGD